MVALALTRSVNPCLLIPIYDHPDTIAEVVAGLAALELPCLIVDDGSHEPTVRVLSDLVAKYPFVRVERRPENGGRGAALKTGYRLAHRLGYTHALQLDADGQHDPADAPALLAAAEREPEALVLGQPIFDETAPRHRFYGRFISVIWVWIETGSTKIRDPLCGLRCIPLAPTVRVLDAARCGDAMDFDPEITVRLFWAGTPIASVPVEVRYFEGGVSHFRLWRDNLGMVALHTRLVLGMLARLLRRGASRGA